MYSILLVEDEKIELDTLRDYVDWKGNGIERVFTARGGRSALQCIAEYEPDIVITDIQMPGMSGIELADIIRQDGYKCKIVFLTGYDRFEYAKEAIRLQAEDFLLKPFQIDEVEALVRKLVDKLDHESFSNRMNRLAIGEILEKACHGDTADAFAASEFYFQKQVDQVYFHMLAIAGTDPAADSEILALKETEHAFHEKGLLIVLINQNLSCRAFAGKLLASYPDTGMQVVYHTETVGISSLNRVMNRILSCEDDLFYREIRTIMDDSEHRIWRPYEECMEQLKEKTELLHEILKGEEAGAGACLSRCFDVLKDMGKDGVRKNAFQLFVYLHNNLDQYNNLDSAVAVPNLMQADRYEALYENLSDYVKRCTEIAAQRKNARWSDHVKRYVALHYMEDCTVEEMAELLKVSPNYLRRKFKEETNITILEYVTEQRLEIAADMLRRQGKKVKDVGAAVGYPNISYFTQLFAKKYGVTPNEYKKGN